MPEKVGYISGLTANYCYKSQPQEKAYINSVCGHTVLGPNAVDLFTSCSLLDTHVVNFHCASW